MRVGDKQQVAQPFARTDIFADHRADDRIGHCGPQPEEDLIGRRRKDDAPHGLRPRRAHQTGKPDQFFVDGQQAGISIEENQKKAGDEDYRDLRRDSKTEPHDEDRGQRDLWDAVEADDIGLERSGQEARAAENEPQRKPHGRSEHVAGRDLGQGHINVAVNVVMAQQVIQPCHDLARATEIRKRRLRDCEFPEAHKCNQDRQLSRQNPKSICATLPARDRDGHLGCPRTTLTPRLLICRSAEEPAFLLFDLIDLDLEARAVDAFAVRQLEGEDMQRTTDHGVVGRELRIQHRRLHMRACALDTAITRPRLEDHDSLALQAGTRRILDVIGAKAGQRMPRLFRHLQGFRKVLSVLGSRAAGAKYARCLHLCRERTLAGHIAQPADRERLLKPDEKKSDLHRKALIQE